MTSTESLNAQVAAAIRVELARTGMDQGVLARSLGWTPSSFSRRMTGQYPFTTEDIEKIAQQLGLELDQLMRPVTR